MHYFPGCTSRARHETETWTISSSMKIMHTHHPCRSSENCGSVQRQISQIAVVDVIILDGAAIINMLKPVEAKTFQDYAMLVFLPYTKAQLARVTKVNIIWDVYIPDSLKSTARENRGKGVRRRVAAANSIPGNWQEFLRVDENKTELFNFLAHEVVENLSTEKEVFSTCGKHMLCSRVHQDVSALAPCSHARRIRACSCTPRMRPKKVISGSCCEQWIQTLSSWLSPLLYQWRTRSCG